MHYEDEEYEVYEERHVLTGAVLFDEGVGGLNVYDDSEEVDDLVALLNSAEGREVTIIIYVR